MVLVLTDERLDDIIVDMLCSIEVRQEEPDEKTQADPIPVRDEVENEA